MPDHDRERVILVGRCGEMELLLLLVRVFVEVEGRLGLSIEDGGFGKDDVGEDGGGEE